MRAYDSLHVFPEIPRALQLLQENNYDGGDNKEKRNVIIEAHIFSNGTREMIGNSVKTSPELGPSASVFHSLITVDGLQCFKPDPRTYEHLVEHAGMKDRKEDVWVVSANPFDVAGARAFGLKAAFIDRAGKGWIDRIDDTRVPSVVARGVDEAIKSILNY
jgi:2-haloacid dehalogenase